MQVKKFEAKSMKDALEMVKNELGPDAVILRAREISRGFGLMGDGSVEVTAAVSETTLKRKAFAENRLKADSKEKFKTSSAKVQREYIDKAIERQQKRVAEPAYARANATAQPSQQRYADIDGDEVQVDQQSLRIQGAAKSAARAFEESMKAEAPQTYGTTPVSATPVLDDGELLQLREEVKVLRDTVDKFRQMPRTIVSIHPGADYGLPYELSFMFEKLVAAGVSVENTVELLKSASRELGPEQYKKRNLVEAWSARRLLNQVRVDDQPFGGRIHLFVGPGGQGKTSMIARIASHYVVKKKKKVALLTTDRFKIGAAEQLRIYAQILNAQFVIVKDKAEWHEKLHSVSGADVILVDFPGFGLRTSDEVDTFRRLLPPEDTRVRTHLVLSATNKDVDAIEAGRRYAVSKFEDVIFTHLDAAANHGLLYNFQKFFEVPLHSFGTGSKIPGDFEVASRERVLDSIFQLSQTESRDQRSMES